MEIEYDRYGRIRYSPEIHPNQGKPWLTSDQKYLIENYEKIGPEEVSFALGRTTNTVMQYACKCRFRGTHTTKGCVKHPTSKLRRGRETAVALERLVRRRSIQVEIEDAGELRKFETMPNEGTLYLSLVRYESGGWMNGPCSMDKNEVMRMLGNWAGAKAARIYAVKVPIDAMPAA